MAKFIIRFYDITSYEIEADTENEAFNEAREQFNSAYDHVEIEEVEED